MRFSPGAAIAPLLLASVLIVPGAGTHAQVYRWTDTDGVVHFADSPDKIPARYRSALEEPPASAVPEGAAPVGDARAPGAPPEKAAVNREGPAEPPAEKETLVAPSEDAAPAPIVSLDNFGRDETWWRDRRKFWEQRLADSRRLHQEARRELNRVNQRYDSREYKQMKLLRERMDTLEGEIAKAQEMLGGGLAREARKAGAPPGWVR